jgi:hypothetical protein
VEEYLNAFKEWEWTTTWRWLCVGRLIGGDNRYWDWTSWLVYVQLWDYDKSTFLVIPYVELTGGRRQSAERNAGCWRCILESTHNSKKHLKIANIHLDALLSRFSSVREISVRVDWLRQSGRAPSEPSETPRWRITLCPASIECVAFHIAFWLLFHLFFLCSRSPILNDQSGVVANCDHTS